MWNQVKQRVTQYFQGLVTALQDLNIMWTWRRDMIWKEEDYKARWEELIFADKVGLHIPLKNRAGLPHVDDAKIESNIRVENIILTW